MASAGEPRLGITQELLNLCNGLARSINLLIRFGLKAATSLDPHNKRDVMPGFLANVEKATQTDLQLELQQIFQHNDYLSYSVDHCTLCKTDIVVNLGQGCYWTHDRIYHIDCINCPSCNGPPKVVYVEEGKSFVQCSRCNYGNMITFISQNFGRKIVILYSRSIINAHLLYVAWARAAYALKPKVAPCM